MCDMRWEVRDSTVEFLGKASASAEGVGDVQEGLLGGCSFTAPLLKEALKDSESYVRASAISALALTLTRSWQQGAAVTQEQVNVLLLL